MVSTLTLAKNSLVVCLNAEVQLAIRLGGSLLGASQASGSGDKGLQTLNHDSGNVQ